MDVRDDISVKEYFEEVVPELFKEELSGTAITGMEGTEFSVQFDITDGEKQTYGIVIKDAKDLEVVSGPVQGPIIAVELSEDVWRGAVTGKLEGVMDIFTDMGQLADRSRYDQLRSISGTLDLDLGSPDGSSTKIRITFNGAQSPRASFSVSLEDWVAMTKGELSGVNAFMSGKLKIEGDMPFAMALGNLVA